MSEKQLIYFCTGIGSVFDSQVVELLNGICERKIFQKIYLVIGIKGKYERLKIKKEKIHPDLNIILYKVFPNYTPYNFLNRFAIKNAIRNIDISNKNTIFHTREEILAWHLLNILNESEHHKILPDIRGANMEEVKQFFGFNSMRQRLKVSNYKKAIKSLNRVKRISVVSDSLKTYLVEKFGLNAENIVINSCLAGKHFNINYKKREEVRQRLNLEEDDVLLVFSSGGVARWQDNNVLKSFIRNRIKLLNLSKIEIHQDKVINKFVDYYDIPDYLNAADIAVLWRGESVVNKVASPVKFSEYLCCGLPVITNDSIELVKEVIEENDVGLILNTIDQFNEKTVAKVSKINRDHVNRIGQKVFGFETILRQYESLYNQFFQVTEKQTEAYDGVYEETF